ncbi:MAG TPA: hypothetical protein DHV42_01035 [Lachnospiraceae bacterium]|nr:hypothetical protein [Lachnospiraceae bacterium]
MKTKPLLPGACFSGQEAGSSGSRGRPVGPSCRENMRLYSFFYERNHIYHKFFSTGKKEVFRTNFCRLFFIFLEDLFKKGALSDMIKMIPAMHKSA